MYGLPGGIIDKDETPEQAAQRELLEETGYSAPLETFQKLSVAYPLPAMTEMPVHYVYVPSVKKVDDNEKAKHVVESSENLKSMLMTREELEEAIKKGPCDGNLLSGYLYFKLFIGGEK